MSNVYPLYFKYILINIQNGYDANSNSFQPPKAGLYWFLFDVSSNESIPAHYWISDSATGANTSIVKTKSTTKTLSQNNLFYVQPLSKLKIFAQNAINLTQVNLHALTWSGFYIETISSTPPIAFSVARLNESLLPNKALAFNVVYINIGQCWNDSTYVFIAPVSGVYIFSFSCTTKRLLGDINMVINNAHITPIQTSSLQKSTMIIGVHGTTSINSVISVSGSAVIKLYKNDSAFIAKDSRNDYSQASLRGFLYSPVSDMFIAWSARLVKEEKRFTFDVLDDFNFEDISLNIGDVFKGDKNSTVIIPVDGIYYVTFQTAMIPSATITLSINGTELNEITLIEVSDKTYASGSYERSLLLQLTSGNKLSLSLRLQYGKSVFFTCDFSPVFAGFLVVPL